MSDTKLELVRDAWNTAHFEMCGTCRYLIKIKGKKYCNNVHSDKYGDDIDYSDGCAAYQEPAPLHGKPMPHYNEKGEIIKDD